MDEEWCFPQPAQESGKLNALSHRGGWAKPTTYLLIWRSAQVERVIPATQDGFVIQEPLREACDATDLWWEWGDEADFDRFGHGGNGHWPSTDYGYAASLISGERRLAGG
jgi:hypothetical protein